MWDKTNETDLGRRVAALESQTVALQERVKAVLAVVEVRYAPVGDHAGLWRCPAVNCYHHYGAAWCRHGRDHERRHDCAEFCCCNTCQPVPAPAAPVDRCIPEPAIPDQITIDSMAHLEPEVAIPDVPMAVGTERFQARLRGHIQELGGAYSWGAGHPVEWKDDYLERLAGVACTLRDAYDLARIGETQAARQKLEEIEW